MSRSPRVTRRPGRLAGSHAAPSLGDQQAIRLDQPLPAQAVKHVVVLDSPSLHRLVRAAPDAATLGVHAPPTRSGSRPWPGASARSRRARPAGSFTVNTTVGSGTGTPRGCCCAASTYRRAWRGETRYQRASVRNTAAGGNRRSRPSARLTRSAYWASRARRRSCMCHDCTLLCVLPVNVFDTGPGDRARPGPRQSLRLRGRGHHPALRHPAFPGHLDHQPQHVQDLRIPNPPRHLPEQHIMPHGAKGNGYTLPTTTSRGFRSASRSRIRTIPLKGRR